MILRRLVCRLFGHPWGAWWPATGDPPRWGRGCYRCHVSEYRTPRKFYQLIDVEERHRMWPTQFWIPSLASRCNLRLGDQVQLIFVASNGPSTGERLWVTVVKSKEDQPSAYIGLLNNPPITIPTLKWGDTVEFLPKHIANSVRKETK